MVKLYALTVLYKGPTSASALKCAYDVESFSYFQRGSVREFMAFVTKTIVERTQIAARQSVKEGGNILLINQSILFFKCITDKKTYFCSLRRCLHFFSIHLIMKINRC